MFIFNFLFTYDFFNLQVNDVGALRKTVGYLFGFVSEYDVWGHLGDLGDLRHAHLCWCPIGGNEYMYYFFLKEKICLYTIMIMCIQDL